MCGITGIFDLRGQHRVDCQTLDRMAQKLIHRGPNDQGQFIDENLGFGFRRLSIIDLEGGNQPMFNEDRSLVLVCNGEIFNYRELRSELIQKGHVFASQCDVEVLLHLYEEKGTQLLGQLNGQFAFALYDRRKQLLFLARDPMGITPLYFAVADGLFLFGSEIKAILEHPSVERQVDLTGLDQVLTFAGLASPRTLFKGINSLNNGHSILVRDGDCSLREYWDLRYPRQEEAVCEKPESHYVERLRELFLDSVKLRLQADVPVGFYLSGGLDSAMVASAMEMQAPGVRRHSFSINFSDKEMTEEPIQNLMAARVRSIHHNLLFDAAKTSQGLSEMLYFSECPVRESYNVCTRALSREANQAGVRVTLAGQGADEIFGGYIGYRFDNFKTQRRGGNDLETALEDEVRQRIWGNPNIFYERDYYAFGQLKQALYAPQLQEAFLDFDCLNFDLVNKERLKGIHPLHCRSYLDFKFRLVDHLLIDHGDKMALSNSVEIRHPFLDIRLVEFACQIPPCLKVNGFTEKYVLRKAAEGLLPEQLTRREKFGWYAPGSPQFLQQKIDWVQDTLSYERIKRQGYFDPDVIERIKKQYSEPGFKLSLPFEDDFLIVVLTFSLFLDVFKLPSLN